MTYSQMDPQALALKAANVSNYMAEHYDGGPDDLSSHEWDEMAEQLAEMVSALSELTQGDEMAMLMAAGADPDVVFNGGPQ